MSDGQRQGENAPQAAKLGIDFPREQNNIPGGAASGRRPTNAASAYVRRLMPLTVIL